MAESQRFRIRRPEVIHEILDDELVIVNLKTGAYFSLDPVGAVIWEEVDRNATPAEIVSDVKARFDGDAALIEGEVKRLLRELEREQLIGAHDDPGSTATKPAPPLNGRAPFSPPLLQKYTDMQELLLLDPIHEVDESGWPTRET